MSDKFHEQPDNRHQPRGGSSPREKRSSLNCEMNSTSTRSSPQREAENIFRTGQRFPRGRLGWTHFTHQKPVARDRRASTCPLPSRAQRPATPHPAEPSASPRRRRTPAPAHCGPSTVPRGPAGAGELPTPQEGRWVRAARALPGPAGHPGAPHPHREALSSRAPEAGARRPARGGIQGWTGSERPAGRAGGQLRRGAGPRPPPPPLTCPAPASCPRPRRSAARPAPGPPGTGSASSGSRRPAPRRPGRRRASPRRHGVHAPGRQARSASSFRGQHGQSRPRRPPPPRGATAKGSRRRRSRRREPAALTSLPAGGPAHSRSELANERREAANPPRPPRPAPSRCLQPS